MKAFQTKLINGKLGDPALFILLLDQGEGLLFDLGDLSRFQTKKIHRVSSIFISHAHIDHFIGFDHFLRVMLGQRNTVRIYGPKGMVEKVFHRLQGYSWNLIDRGNLSFEVYEVAGPVLEGKKFFLREKCFQAHPLPAIEHRGVLWETDLHRVDFAVLDHKIDSLAFALVRKKYPRVDKNWLENFSCPPGPWIQDVLAFAQGMGEDRKILENKYSLGELSQKLILWEEEEKIAYVVDTIYSPEVEAKVISLARGAEVFFCESSYLTRDSKKATTNHHLTAAQAGLMAWKARVKKFIPFHFSWSYNGSIRELEEEAQRAFEGGE